MRSKEADHECDREKSEEERQAEPERQHVGRGEERLGLPSVEQRLRTGADDHRRREQEAETRGVGAADGLVEPGRDRDPGAADAGQQSDGLRDTHDDRIDEAERLERPAGHCEALGRDEDDRPDDEERGDVRGRPEPGLDLRLERDAGERGRQRADDDEERHAQPQVQRVTRELQPGAREVEQHRERRSEVQRDVEAEAEPRGIEPQSVADEHEMRGRAHREELGEPLHDPEDRRRREVVHLMPARAAPSASCASRSCPSAASSCFAHDRRCPASRNRVATEAPNGPMPTFFAASAT